MGKIICEICGTSYPDTAEQCPICGNVRAADNTVSDSNAEGNQAAETGYTYVKGGRFSKSNVKKRNKAIQKGMPAEPARKAPKAPRKQQPDRQPEKSSNKGLIITAVIMLVLVLAVAAFIVLRYFWPLPFLENKETKPSETTMETTLPPQTEATTQATTEATTEPVTQATTVPAVTDSGCTTLKLTDERIELDAAGRAWLLEVIAEPAETTDVITFASSDERVATVDQTGRVTAVAGGQAVITVTCGTQTAQCRVVCNFGDAEIPVETTQPTEPAETTKPAPEELKISHTDVTMSYKGEAFEITVEGLNNSDVTWSVNNSGVASVSNGYVTAVGPGMTTIIVEYNGMRAECIIRCNFS